jgi:hypothetical protein
MWQFLGHACKITNIKRESDNAYVWEVTGYSCQKKQKKHYLTEKGKKWAGCVWEVEPQILYKRPP